MKDERFENFLKDRLYSEESSLDTTSFWDSLEVQLDEDERNNRKVGYYRLAGIASVLLLGILAVEFSIPDIESANADFAQINNQSQTKTTSIESNTLQFEAELPSTKSNVAAVTQTNQDIESGSLNLTEDNNKASSTPAVKSVISADVQPEVASDVSEANTISSIPQINSSILPSSTNESITIEPLPLASVSTFASRPGEINQVGLEQLHFSSNSSWNVAYVFESGIAPGYQKVSFTNDKGDVQEDRLSMRSYIDANIEFKSIISTPGILQMEAGIRYNYTRESYDNHETIYTEEFVNDAKAGGTNKPGSSVELSERETKVLVKKDKEVDKKIVVHSFEVPVGVGFNIQKSNWNWGAMAGVLGQVRVSAYGHSLIRTDDNEYRYRDDVWNDTDTYSFGWYGNAHFGYRLGNEVELWARPYVKQFPNAYHNEELDVDLSYLQAGLKIGATWNFHS